MTVQYNAEIATATFSGFFKLMLRWRGSVYKLLWRDFLVYVAVYYGINMIYWYALNDDQRMVFMQAVFYCDKFSSLIPVSFVLGFYVTNIVTRWSWEQFNLIPWPSRFAILVTSHIRGEDESIRMLRRTLVRYTALGFLLTMVSISPAVKLRFPTLEHITKAGFMMPHEQEMYEAIPTKYNKFYIPFVWASTLIARARQLGRVKDEFGMMALVDEVNQFRTSCQTLFNYDWIAIPIVYTQVVTLAVYMYSLAMIMGQQYTGASSQNFYFPFFVFMQFFFYQGWLKVGEELMNPFGQDDDDFEVNSIVDSYLQLSYLIVDSMHGQLPELHRDQYWDTTDVVIPYTEAALQHQKSSAFGEATYKDVPEEKKAYVDEPVAAVDDEPARLASTSQGSEVKRRRFSLFRSESEKARNRVSTIVEEQDEVGSVASKTSFSLSLRPSHTSALSPRPSSHVVRQSSSRESSSRESLRPPVDTASALVAAYSDTEAGDDEDDENAEDREIDRPVKEERVFTPAFVRYLFEQLADLRRGVYNGASWITRKVWN